MTDLTACPDYPALQQLARALWRTGGGRGAAVLVGAGVSRSARVAGGNAPPPPLWFDLAQEMAERLYPGETSRAPTDPLRLAEEFRTYFGQAALDEFVRRMIDDGAWSPSQTHRMLLALPWSDVLTTNYDTLLERASRTADREYQPVVSEADLAHARPPRIVKLHGSMGASEPFVIAEEDYRTYPSRRPAFVNLARQVFVENELVLVGFSGDDPNFAAWAGWVRDHLGSTARRIYLAGALNLGPAKRKFLEARNIAPIDLHHMVHDLDPSLRHAAALDLLLVHLATVAPVPPHRWEPARTSGLEPTTNRNLEAEAERLRRIVKSWRADRMSYPGWLVCPNDLRQRLRQSVEAAPFSMPILLELEPQQAASAVVELCWHHRVALWPLHPSVVSLVERFAVLETGDLLSLPDRLIVASTIARQARSDGYDERFERIAALVERLSPGPSDAAAEIAYLRAQRASLAMRFDEALIFAEQIIGDDPFWGVRRASILAEAGCQSEAEALVKDALADLRDRHRADRESIWIGSRLAWGEMMARAFAQSRFEFGPWNERHQAIRSDPFAEVSSLRNRVAERQRSEQTTGRTPTFAPGSYTDHSRALRFRSWSNVEPFVELDLMLLDGGVPPRLETVSLFTAERLDALQLIASETLNGHLHLLRLLDDSEKSFSRHWSRLRVALLPADLAQNLVQCVEGAITYWMGRVTSGKEPMLLAAGRMRLAMRALARLALRLAPDEAVRVYQQGLTWLRRFQGPAQSDVLAELLMNAWSAIPPKQRPELVPETLDVPLSPQHLGVDPMRWLIEASAEHAAHDVRRPAWVHRWINAVRSQDDLRQSATLRLLHLRDASALEPSEEDAFAEALWTRVDGGSPPMPADTMVHISFWATIHRCDGLDAVDSVRARLFRPSGQIADWQLSDIRGAIETGRLLPDPTQARDLFDQLCREEPALVGDDVVSAVNANLSGYNRRYMQRLISVTLAAVGSALAIADLTDERAEALLAYVAKTGAIAAVSVLARWPATPNRLVDVASAIRQGLRGATSEAVADAVDVMLRWEAGLAGAQAPVEMLELVEAVVSAIEYRRTHAVWHLLRAATRLVEASLTTAAQSTRLAIALLELLSEWEYANIVADSEEAGVVSLVRAACVELAGALKKRDFSSADMERWLTEAAADPLPEVRFAAELPA